METEQQTANVYTVLQTQSFFRLLHQNTLERLLKPRGLSPNFRVSDSTGLGQSPQFCFSNKIPSAAAAVDLETALGEPLT